MARIPEDQLTRLKQTVSLQRLADDPHLHLRIVGSPEQVPERKLDRQGTGDANPFRPVGHIGHQDG